MKVYVYQKGWMGAIEAVSTDKIELCYKAWDDFCAAFGKDQAIQIFGCVAEDDAFVAFMENGGMDDWEITEWEV